MRNRLLITAVSLLACIYPASSHAMEPVQEDVLEISNAWVRGFRRWSVIRRPIWS